MPPGRKSISTSSKSSLSANDHQSPNSNKSIFDRGSVIWCKYKKYPYWPGIIWDTINKSNRTLYDILFFGTFSLGLSINCKWLEAYEGVGKFKKRINELKASEILVKNKTSQYDMNIALANLESFQEAIKQASKVIKCSNARERLDLADKMRKGALCDFFQLDIDEDDDDDEEDDVDENDETNSMNLDDNISILSLPPIQNDQQFIETMINQGRRKRKLAEQERHANKLRRITVKTEPEQSTDNFPSSLLFRHTCDQPIIMCSNFVCHSLSPTEETFILDAIARSGSSCPFFQAKQIAEETYSHIIYVNNSNRPLPVSEIWFYLFFHLHFQKLFTTYPHWLNDLEQNPSPIPYLHEQQQQIIRLMKTYLP